MKASFPNIVTDCTRLSVKLVTPNSRKVLGDIEAK